MIIVVVFLTSCSSNSPNEDTTTPPITTRKFNMLINGVDSHLTESIYSFAYRDGHTIRIGDDYRHTVGFNMQITFDENGHFGQMIYKQQLIASDTPKYFYSGRNYSSQYFTLIIQDYDQVNKQIKGTFSGYLYYNPENLNSESKFVSGSFDLPILDYVPAVSGLINEADINTQSWRSTNKFQTNGDNTGQYEELNLHFLRDDEYKMTFTFHKTTTTAGTYNFTPTTLINKIKFAKYDLNTASYINYNCTGTVQILSRPPLCYDGIYNFTAVNPNDPADIIQVQNGKFRVNYWPY